MHLEVEQKFRVTSLAGVRERLLALGARFAEPIEQADLYFSHPAKSFAKTDEALRLRRVGEQNCITYKGPKLDRQTKTRRELELPLAAGQQAFEQFAELLRALGFGEVATVRKRRAGAQLVWQGAEIEAALDEVAGVGTFIELEICADEAGLTTAKNAVQSLATQLGLTEIERRSYLELLLSAAPN